MTVTKEVAVKGKVKGTKDLGVGAEEGFCFLTRARSWTSSDGFFFFF